MKEQDKLFKVSDKTTYATGKRKTSIAKVWVNKGKGRVRINGIDVSQYFCRSYNSSQKNSGYNSDVFKSIALEALQLTDNLENFDVICSVSGGGFTGQVEAIRHGIAKCLRIINEDYKKVLRPATLLTRDSRIVERKKYGRRKARRSTQFSKR